MRDCVEAAAPPAELVQIDALTPALLRLLEGRAAGVWLLNAADPIIEYTQYDRGTINGEIRTLSLATGLGAGSVIVIRLLDEDLSQPTGLSTLSSTPGYCRVCGCSDDNACVDDDEEPCHWVAGDLCSACAPEEAAHA